MIEWASLEKVYGSGMSGKGKEKKRKESTENWEGDRELKEKWNEFVSVQKRARVQVVGDGVLFWKNRNNLLIATSVCSSLIPENAELDVAVWPFYIEQFKGNSMSFIRISAIIKGPKMRKTDS